MNMALGILPHDIDAMILSGNAVGLLILLMCGPVKSQAGTDVYLLSLDETI